MVGHEHIPPDAHSKVSCASAISQKCFVHFGLRKQRGADVSVECYKVNWRIEALKDQIQSRRLILEDSLHGPFCNAQYPQCTSSEIQVL